MLFRSDCESKTDTRLRHMNANRWRVTCVLRVRCVLVALRLAGFLSRVSPILLYCTATAKGETAPCARRISTSQIYVIFYGIKTLNTVFLVVIAALGDSKAAIC